MSLKHFLLSGTAALALLAAQSLAHAQSIDNTRQLPRLDAASTKVLACAPTALGSESARLRSVRIRDALLTT